MQDPNPLPWGTQDRFQAHYIVRKQSDNPLDLTARTVLETTGHFGSKKVTAVQWQGGKIADTLNSDSVLNELIAQQSVDDATITIDPTQKVFEFMENGKVVLNLMYQKHNLKYLIR